MIEKEVYPPGCQPFLYMRNRERRRLIGFKYTECEHKSLDNAPVCRQCTSIRVVEEEQIRQQAIAKSEALVAGD